MSTPAEVVAALHAGADQLDPLVRDLTAEQLTRPSAAGAWDLSQVLAHLDLGAEIWVAALDAAVAGQPVAAGADQAVWARWDAMTPAERAPAYLEANAAVLARYDAIVSTAPDGLQVDLTVLPHPVDVATTALFWLNEFTLHSWDIRVALDPAAALHGDAVPLLLDTVAPLLTRVAKPSALAGRDLTVAVTLHEPDQAFKLHLSADGCAMGEVPGDPGATLVASGEAWLRLVSGRLAATHTPPGVQLSGPVGLDSLRQVFPGY
jgi:uncharacterized protein (TIGR03083 family)